jgi:hypothetical protein
VEPRVPLFSSASLRLDDSYVRKSLQCPCRLRYNIMAVLYPNNEERLPHDKIVDTPQ